MKPSLIVASARARPRRAQPRSPGARAACATAFDVERLGLWLVDALGPVLDEEDEDREADEREAEADHEDRRGSPAARRTRRPNASSGPIIAPAVSRARCTPNAVPELLLAAC